MRVFLAFGVFGVFGTDVWRRVDMFVLMRRLIYR